METADRTRDDVVLAVERVWRTVLALDTSTPDDDFFMLGGDSVMAVLLIHNIEQELSIRFPIEALLRNGTLGALTEACLASARLGNGRA